MTREDKKINKEHCKDAPFKTKLQCWYFRNETEVKTVILSLITSVITHIVIIAVLVAVMILQQRV